MTMINLTKIQKNVAGRALFTIDHLVASAGDKIGVVGRNGTGKSTLAHLITGVDTDYRGQLVTDVPVSYVPQLAPTLDQSGGQAMMSRIRQALSARPAILILDEPSSNLDEAHQQWLVAQLQGFHGLLMLISHDRHLLDAVTNQTWAFEGQRVQAYAGNYAHYLKSATNNGRRRKWPISVRCAINVTCWRLNNSVMKRPSGFERAIGGCQRLSGLKRNPCEKRRRPRWSGRRSEWSHGGHTNRKSPNH